MTSERYPGERHGLIAFLKDLQPVAAGLLGEGTLLQHAIRRALDGGDLDRLRHARTLYNNLPKEQRQQLSRALASRGSAVPALPARDELLERYGRRPPAGFVSFELAPGSGEQPGDDTRVSLTHELLPHSALRVLVSPGTLPQTAADGLRRIAAMIEQDRRLLSAHHWEQHGAGAGELA